MLVFEALSCGELVTQLLGRVWMKQYSMLSKVVEMKQAVQAGSHLEENQSAGLLQARLELDVQVTLHVVEEKLLKNCWLLRSPKLVDYQMLALQWHRLNLVVSLSHEPKTDREKQYLAARSEWVKVLVAHKRLRTRHL